MSRQSQLWLGLLVGLVALVLPAAAVVDKWTPADFNWSSRAMGAPETWKGLYHNLSDPSVAVSKSVMALGDVRVMEDKSVALAIPFYLGFAYQAFYPALTGSSLADTIAGCQQTKGKADSSLHCVGGLVSTVIVVGGVTSAAKNLAKSKGFLCVAANEWDRPGLEEIAVNAFDRRGIDVEANTTAQKAHNHFVHGALSSLAVDGEVEFVGYAPDEHVLARRWSSEHPLAPMFRFTHHWYGRMEVTSRDSGDEGAMHFTVSYAGHPTHQASKEKRNEYYQHERLSSGLLQGRFDGEASLADPATISLDGAGAFGQIDKEVRCSLGGSWPGGNVLSVQMYDQANEATFGFASIGMFADNVDGFNLERFAPSGMPLPSKQDC